MNSSGKIQEDNIESGQFQLSEAEYLSGLRYARMIQLAVMPDKAAFRQMPGENFVLNAPRDILGGDFFYVHKKDEYSFYAVGDATGHGVPGSLLTILGINILNEIMLQRCKPKANRILNQMREKLMKALSQTGDFKKAHDSIDFALCMYNENTRELEYAGANRPLVRVRKHKLEEWKPDKMTIGVAPLQEQSFTNQTIKVKKGDIFYLFSDGYPDQFNWKTNKKLKYRPFLQILEHIADQPMEKQKQFLEEYLLAWKGKSLQIDDVLVFGFRF